MIFIDPIEGSVVIDSWEHNMKNDFVIISGIAMRSKHKRLPNAESIFNNMMAYKFIETGDYKCDPVDKIVIMGYLKSVTPVWAKELFPDGNTELLP